MPLTDWKKAKKGITTPIRPRVPTYQEDKHNGGSSYFFFFIISKIFLLLLLLAPVAER